MQTVFRTFVLLLFCTLFVSGCVEDTGREDYSYGKYTELGSMSPFPGTLIQEGGFSVPLGNDKTLWLTGRLGVEVGTPSSFSYYGHAAGIADRGVVPTGDRLEWLINEDGSPKQIFPLTPEEIAYNSDTTNTYHYQIVPTGGIQVGDSTYVYGIVERMALNNGQSDDREMVLCVLDENLNCTRTSLTSMSWLLSSRVQPMYISDFVYLFVPRDNKLSCYRSAVSMLRNFGAYEAYTTNHGWISAQITLPSPLIDNRSAEVIWSGFLNKYIGLAQFASGPVLEFYSSASFESDWEFFQHPLVSVETSGNTFELRLHPDLFRDEDRTIVLSYLERPIPSGVSSRKFAEFTFHEE